ncbi:unnamed protein product [Arabidopsis halleri]
MHQLNKSKTKTEFCNSRLRKNTRQQVKDFGLDAYNDQPLVVDQRLKRRLKTQVLTKYYDKSMQRFNKSKTKTEYQTEPKINVQRLNLSHENTTKRI